MIPVLRPSMADNEVKAVEEVLKSGWIVLGPKTLEETFLHIFKFLNNI